MAAAVPSDPSDELVLCKLVSGFGFAPPDVKTTGNNNRRPSDSNDIGKLPEEKKTKKQSLGVGNLAGGLKTGVTHAVLPLAPVKKTLYQKVKQGLLAVDAGIIRLHNILL